MLEEAERSGDPEAMRKLAERMVAATAGGEAGGGRGAAGEVEDEAEALRTEEAALRRAHQMTAALEQAARGSTHAMARATALVGGGGGPALPGAVGGLSAAARSSEVKLEEMRRELEERKAAMHAAQGEVDRQLEAARAALEGKQKAEAEYEEAERRRVAQARGDENARSTCHPWTPPDPPLP